MNIGANSLFAEMQNMTAQINNDIRPQTTQIAPQQINPSTAQFGDLLTQAINNVNELGQAAGEARNRFEMGDQSISLADVMIAKEKSSIAGEATIQVRNKLLEAYEKIMQMPV